MLLGPVQARVDGQPINVGVRRQRVVLAVLALQPNRLVTAERLVDLCWPDKPPPTARRVIHTQISQLRATLSRYGVGIRGDGPGYALDCDPDHVDAHRFTALHAQARAAGDDPTRVALLATALDLWRGPAMADAPDQTRTRLCAHLEQARLDATEDRLDALLRLGNQHDVINEATQLAREHPHRHRITATLVLALYQAGRTADALETYRHTRQHLADELGIDPPDKLRELEVAILRNDPTLSAPAHSTIVAPMPVPRQLPADAAAFTGRSTELDRLLAPDQLPATVVISAIDGMAGIGKTALAVHAAHRLADRYPDGQLFIDLHGYTQGAKPVEPAEALDHLLRALGVPGAQLPSSLDQRAALLRTRLAGQRVLIVLDNAATEAQVAPLLPGSPGPLVLVTSRRRLTGLDHTHTLSLETLPAPDAIALFARTVGEDRLAGQPPDLLTELVELCGRLPLAIRIAAARLRSRRTWSLSHLVGRLRDQRHRLAELTAGPRSITAALDLSYQDLSPDQQQTYRLLSSHPGPEFGAYATAALLDATLPHAEQVLDQLVEAHLLQEPTPGRYRFHDLARAHAAHTATGEQTAPAALGRLLDHYLNTARAAMYAAYPYEREHRPDVPSPPTPSPTLADSAAALAWLDTELPNLLAAAERAIEHGRPTHLVDTSTILHSHLRSRGRYDDAETLHQRALTIARAAGDEAGQRNALNGLGDFYLRQGRYERAAQLFEQVLRIARTTGHHPAELNALAGLGHIHRLQGRHERAAEHFAQVLRIARATGHDTRELEALNGLGYIYLRQGRYERAAEHFGQVLQVARTTGHRVSELEALNGLGNLHRLQGRHERAARHFEQALLIARATGSRTGELNALTGLGDIHRMQGRHRQASDIYEQLLDLAQSIGYHNYEFEARQGLGRLSHATGHPQTAVAHHERALTLADELNQPDDQARAHDGLADAHHALHQHEQARTHWQHALNLLTDLGIDHTDEETTAVAIRAHLAAG